MFLRKSRQADHMFHLWVYHMRTIKVNRLHLNNHLNDFPACRTYLIATRFWVVVICPIIKCLTVLEFSFILFDLCLFITIFNFILNYIPIVTFWIFTYHKIWILLLSSVLCEIIELFIFQHVWKCFGVLWVNWCQFAVALANKVKIGLVF